jgi:hypothetical protein
VKILEKNLYYKLLFLIGAIWNWGAGIIFLILSIFIPSSIEIFGAEIPSTFIWFHIILALVLLFGLFFFMTSRNLEKYHDIAVFFVIEKFIFFFIPFIYFLLGDINFLALTVFIIDLIFGCLYLEFWLKFSA